MKPSELAKVIDRYIKPQTFPLGFKLVKDSSEVPEKVRKFKNLTICQIYNIARRYRWTVYFDLNTTCPLGIVAYGFSEPDELYEEGVLAYEAGYAATKEIGVKFEQAVPRLKPGEYVGCVAFPLERDEMEPDFVVVYATPAQILRFVHAVLYKKGGAFEATVLGRAACAEYLGAFIEKRPRLVIPCYGDRLFGLTQDWELAFSFPFEMAEEIADGLANTHKRGIRYPIPVTSLRVELPMIESYKKSVDSMRSTHTR
ncbi:MULTISPECIES: DUF169 domain-containing protein [unclassified Archaeoglobus]|jgi:uncharacterized protein (DUF169 family)|uniref:DUF169 domain-containing protein n=1 Tax=unclassified Archaeoglobus TaxID=2643606 RepID=UPI0025C566FE|nr:MULTISPECIES: DUF169 domain-containing protein [unclassified Archaeoglobus]